MTNDLWKLLLRILLVCWSVRKARIVAGELVLLRNATAGTQEMPIAADLDHHFVLRPSSKFVFKEVMSKPLLYYFITDIQNNHVPEESNWNVVANNIVESKTLKVENNDNMHNVKKKKNILYLARANLSRERKKII